MPSIARTERLALADLLTELGPDAPTLCAGWDTRALAAHLVVRERRPDTTPGAAISALEGWAEKVRSDYEKKPYEQLVDLVRTGPGRLSPFALPGADRFFNTAEYTVHHEDVRRAQPGWAPRDLPAKVQDAFWKVVRTSARISFRSTEAGVVLRRSDAPRSTLTAKEGEPVVTITGEPLELLVYSFGRRDHARVEVTGDPAAVAALDATSLDV